MFFSKFEYKEAEMYKTLPTNIQFLIPRQNILNGGSAGGQNNDESGIDKHVEKIVQTLNDIKNVETFSSCDGHGRSAWYVLFIITDNDMKKLQLVIDSISEANDIFTNRYKYIFRINTLCGSDEWFDSNGEKRSMSRNKNVDYRDIYFEIRITKTSDKDFYKNIEIFQDIFQEIVLEKKKLIKNTI